MLAISQIQVRESEPGQYIGDGVHKACDGFIWFMTTLEDII